MLKLVGRYELRERIGEGAMADVYRAYDPGIDRVLAVKVLKADFRQNRQYATRFLREARAAGALSHPNIVTIYDVGEVDGYPYIAMELLEGEPLDKLIERRGKMPAADVAAIALQLAEALSYAHGLGVVHRDIKPSNVMLGKDGRTIKLLDFGIARMAEATSGEMEQTMIGQVVGTPRYMSPEQALSRAIDGRSDLFSVGVVLYELLTGTKTFNAVSSISLAMQITQEDPAPIAQMAPETPRGLMFIVDKLLAKRPERRFADGDQLAEALRRELAELEAVRRDARSRRLPLQARTALLMACITAVVLLAATRVVVDRQYQAMERMALTSGSAIASFVASNAALGAADNATLPPEQRDWAPVEAFVKAASADPNVQQMMVIDDQGIVRAATKPALIGQRYRPAAGESVVQSASGLTVTAVAPAAGGAAGFRFVRPILYAGQSFGQVDVSVSKAELDAVASLSRLLMLALAVVTLGSVIVVSYAVARRTVLPLRRLSAALKDAAAGDLDFRISHSRKDEFGELFDDFNRLAAAMQARQEIAEPQPSRSFAPAVGAPMAATDSFDRARAELAALEETRIFTPCPEPEPAPSTGLERIVMNARRHSASQ